MLMPQLEEQPKTDQSNQEPAESWKERIPTVTQPVSYRKAAVIILSVPELKEPLSARTIIEIAKARGMIKEGTGATPDATLAAAMHTDTTGTFLWHSPGKFILVKRAEEFGINAADIEKQLQEIRAARGKTTTRRAKRMEVMDLVCPVCSKLITAEEIEKSWSETTTSAASAIPTSETVSSETQVAEPPQVAVTESVETRVETQEPPVEPVLTESSIHPEEAKAPDEESYAENIPEEVPAKRTWKQVLEEVANRNGKLNKTEKKALRRKFDAGELV